MANLSNRVPFPFRFRLRLSIFRRVRTLGALVDAGIDLDAIQAGIDSLGLPDCRLVSTEVKKKGFRATSITVEHEPEHAHRHLHQITDMIDGSDVLTVL